MEKRQLFEDVLNEEQIKKLKSNCYGTSVLSDDIPNDFYFEPGIFMNGLCLIKYGEIYDPTTKIIDSNGTFIDIDLNDQVKISHGELLSLKPNEHRFYYYTVDSIYQMDPIHQSEFDETPFYVLTVHEDNAIYETFIIDSSRKVIARFSDKERWVEEVGNIRHFHSFVDRSFYFVTENRDFMVFSQRMNTEHKGSSIYYFDEDPFEDVLDSFYENQICEWEMEEEEWNSILLDNKDDYYGIIDCNRFAKGQLIPITNNPYLIESIIKDRNTERNNDFRVKILENKGNGWNNCPYLIESIIVNRNIERNNDFRVKFLEHQGKGWSDDDKYFYGDIIDGEGPLVYPYNLIGVSLKYAFKFYPNSILYLVKTGQILIPNHILEDLGENEVLEKIHIIQEQHLEYNSISSINDKLHGSDKFGIISCSYEGLTLPEIIYTKGGTKFLVNMIRHSNLRIDIEVLHTLIEQTSNQLEKKCYNILLCHILKIKEAEDIRKEAQSRKLYLYESRMEQEEIERDTYYALGGDDYENWKNNCGDLDVILDNMGL